MFLNADQKSYAGVSLDNTRMNYGARLTRKTRSSNKVLVGDLSDDEDDKPALKKTSSSSSSSADHAQNKPLQPITNTPSKVDEPELSAQQSAILEKILKGENYFFTGSAGTGKSVLLRAIIRAFREREIEGKKDENGTFEKKWQEYVRSGGKTEYPKQNLSRRWDLGVTASTGMAGV